MQETRSGSVLEGEEDVLNSGDRERDLELWIDQELEFRFLGRNKRCGATALSKSRIDVFHGHTE